MCNLRNSWLRTKKFIVSAHSASWIRWRKLGSEPARWGLAARSRSASSTMSNGRSWRWRSSRPKVCPVEICRTRQILTSSFTSCQVFEASPGWALHLYQVQVSIAGELKALLLVNLTYNYHTIRVQHVYRMNQLGLIWSKFNFLKFINNDDQCDRMARFVQYLLNTLNSGHTGGHQYWTTKVSRHIC